MLRWLGLAAAGALALGLAACSQQVSWPDQANAGAPDPIALAAGSTIGQTFVALEAGLAGVDVYLAPQGALQGDVRMVVQLAPQAPGAGATLATASLPAASLVAPGFYHFAFSAQPESRLRNYYLRLEYSGPGQVLVGHGPPESYLQGALYRNDGPDDGAQMTFRLDYDPALVARGVAGQALTWLWWLALAVLLFVVPGWALLAWLWPNAGQMARGEQLGLAVGLSLAVYPILFLWTSLVGLHLGWWYAALPVGLGLAALAVRAGRRWRRARPRLGPVDWRSPHLAPDLALVAVLALVFFIRFWAARGLAAPMWGDSYQHSVIAQLIIDHGGLFTDWAPYADLQTFTYHFGFHTLVAVFHWLSGLPLPGAVLWTGQILNGLAAVALYPVAMRVSGQRWAGVGAVLVAGLLSPSPMVYTNWGRYTQLAGQTILPTAIVVAWVFFEQRPAINWRLLGLACLAWGGLALTHYRVLIFAVCFSIAYWLLELLARRGKLQLARTAMLGIGAGLIFLPWFIRTFGGQITVGFLKELATPAGETPAALQQYNSAGALSSYLPMWLWLIVFLCFGWGLWRRDKAVVLLGLWWGIVLVSTNPQWLGLPGEGAISNFAVLIAAYLPAGVLVGAAIAWLRQAAGPRLGLDAALLLVLLALGLWGAHQRLGDLQADANALVTVPDIRAAAWLKDHTPPDARLLVNSFAAYGATSIVGSDAGWWLPVLARRETNVPPLNYAVEKGPRPDYREWINALTAEIQAKGVDDPRVLRELQVRGLTYVYLGQRRGEVNNPGAAVLSAGQMVISPHFRLVYHQDRVWVFAINP
jgi:hypothetical protein